MCSECWEVHIFREKCLHLQAVTLLEAMQSNKQYAELQQTLSQACQFIKYPGHCLRDGNRLLSLLINSLYQDLHYLDIMRWKQGLNEPQPYQPKHYTSWVHVHWIEKEYNTPKLRSFVLLSGSYLKTLSGTKLLWISVPKRNLKSQ